MVRPPEVKVPAKRLFGEIPKLVRRGPGHLPDLVRAFSELAFARILLTRKSVRDLGIPDSAPADTSGETYPSAVQVRAELIGRVSKAIAIVAPRVPWRSDCLIQCLAGRRWLTSHGIAARISIGVKQERAKDGSTCLLAHAWLTADDIIVTGGDVTEFDAFSVPRKP